MKNNEKLKDLSNIVKNARKYSLIGEYGNSLEKYQEAIAIIKERQNEIKKEGEDLKEKWKMTEYNIKSEMLQIKNVLETCLQLHHSHFNYSKKQLEGDEYINENKKLMEKEIMEFYNKDKRIYESKKSNNSINNNSNNNTNNNKNIKPLNKSNKEKNKTYKSKFNLMIDSKKSKTNKINPWFNNKYSILNKNYKSMNTSNDINLGNIKKSRSLKVNTIEKRMFNPLEEFYGGKKESKSNEQNINGKDFSSLNRKSLLLQQKLSLQKVAPFSINIKPNINYISNNNKNKTSVNINSNSDNKKKIKVVQIDLDDNEDKKRINKEDLEIKKEDKKEENLDMVEQALKNLSQLNMDNNDDSF
jgi:hypothetical protein